MRARIVLAGLVLALLVVAPVAAQDWTSQGIDSVADRQSDTEILIRVVTPTPLGIQPGSPSVESRSRTCSPGWLSSTTARRAIWR